MYFRPWHRAHARATRPTREGEVVSERGSQAARVGLVITWRAYKARLQSRVANRDVTGGKLQTTWFVADFRLGRGMNVGDWA